MLTRNSARFVGIGLVVTAALGVVFYPTDEKRVRDAAEAIVSGANAGSVELARALSEHATPNVSIDAAELPEPLRGREAIVAAVGQATQLGRDLRFRAEGI